MQPTTADLERIQGAYDRGRYVDAWREIHGLAPPWEWQDTAARVLGARLCSVLGAPGRAAIMARATHRMSPGDSRAAYFHALYRRGRASLPRLGAFVARHRTGEAADPRVATDWLCLDANLRAALRDFVPANDLLARAEEIAPDRPWVHVEKAVVLLQQDRRRSALASAERALRLQADYRPGVQAVASCRIALGDDEGALALLADAEERLQCGALSLQRAALLVELDRHDEAAACVGRARELMPLLERGYAAFLSGRESDIAARRGEPARAAELAEHAGRSGFYARVRRNARLASPAAERLTLAVPSVRQDHDTCGPATLTSLARYWNVPAEHVEIVEAICYDGTPADAERAWAEEHGFVVREFTVTWDSARALLRRGVPFTLTTVAPRAAHLQAVVGFDEHRGVLICRDPSTRGLVEMLAQEMLEVHAFTGPRGMAMAPPAEAHRLEGLDLPDAALHDAWHELRRALRRHDRDAAVAALACLELRAPDHELVTHGRLTIASYDCNEPERARCLARLAAAHPEEAAPLHWELASLRQLGLRTDRIRLLEPHVVRVGSHPSAWVELAAELADDAREAPRAERLCHVALSRMPVDARAFAVLAHTQWCQGRLADALQSYRTAAILDQHDEGFAGAWFSAARALGRADEALSELRQRFEQHGARAAAPARALVQALVTLDRTSEVRDVLQRAQALRPDDGELALVAARAHLSLRDADAAERELARATKGSSEQERLHVEAAIAEHRADLAAALAVRRRQLEREPASPAVHAALARLLAATEGPRAALDHLREACGRFQHHRQLRQLLIDWLGRWERDGREAALREAVRLHPEDAWMRRELALHLSELARNEDAIAEAEEALRIEPRAPASHHVLSTLFALAGRDEDARRALRASLAIHVDEAWAVGRLLDLAPDRETALADIEPIQRRLVDDAVDGGALDALCSGASPWLSPDELLELVRAFHARRPDLWRSWAQLASQLRQRDRLEECDTVIAQAVARFPHVVALRIEEAQLRRIQASDDAERAALEAALALAPGSSHASWLLSQHHARAGRFAEAEAALRSALARDPHDAACLHGLAELLLGLRRSEEALDAVRRGVEADPAVPGTWDLLETASREAGQPEAGLQLARDLARREPGNRDAWMAVARTATAPAMYEERLAALDRAIALAPLDTEGHDMKARVLALAHDFDAALRACRPESHGDDPPAALRGRAAWIEWERGHRPKALAMMRATLEQHPDYAWGWWNLHEWSVAEGKVDDRRRAVEALARLQPNNMRVLGLLAALRADEGSHDAARAAWERAFAVGPDDGETADALFGLCLKAGDYEAAERVLQRAAPHFTPGWEQALRLELLVSRGDDAPALKAEARAAAKAAGASRGALDRLLRAAQASARHAEILDAFEVVAVSPEGGALAAAALVAREAGLGLWGRCLRILRQLPRGSASWRAAASALLTAAAPAPTLRVGLFILRHRRLLREDDETWGKVGYYLIEGQALRRAAYWMRDWRKREAQAWMLQNLAHALCSMGRMSEATEVSLAAIASAGDRDCSEHRIMLAVAALAADRRDEAARHVSRVSRVDVGPFWAYAVDCVDAALDAHAAAAALSPATTSRERAELLQGYEARITGLGPPGLRRTHAVRARARRAALRVVVGSLGTWLDVLRVRLFV